MNAVESFFFNLSVTSKCESKLFICRNSELMNLARYRVYEDGIWEQGVGFIGL